MHSPRMAFLCISICVCVVCSLGQLASSRRPWLFPLDFLSHRRRSCRRKKGRLVGRASVRALLPDPRATPCTPRMKPNAAARKNGTVAALKRTYGILGIPHFPGLRETFLPQICGPRFALSRILWRVVTVARALASSPPLST